MKFDLADSTLHVGNPIMRPRGWRPPACDRPGSLLRAGGRSGAKEVEMTSLELDPDDAIGDGHALDDVEGSPVQERPIRRVGVTRVLVALVKTVVPLPAALNER